MLSAQSRNTPGLLRLCFFRPVKWKLCAFYEVFSKNNLQSELRYVKMGEKGVME